MISEEEKTFLKTIPASKKVFIKPFNPKIKEISEEIISKIRNLFPALKVLYMGASSLGISGQNDIDIYTLSNPKNFNKYLPELIKIFGKPLHKHDKSIEWKFKRSGFDVEFYLTDPKSPSVQRQIQIFNILKSNKKLLKEYENLKLSFNGKSFRDYQKAKYEFYNRILTTKAEDFLGEEVEVVIDRPLGSKHPKHDFIYKTNYGYIPNTKSPDGEELDAYYLGIDKPIKKAKGTCIAIIHRTNDNDDKLVVVHKGVEFSDEEIEKQTEFQEQWFKHIILKQQ